MRTAVFVDTSFFVGLALREDEHHANARTLLASLGDTPATTTNMVRGETWTLLRRRSDHTRAVRFLDNLERSSWIRVETLDMALEQVGLDWLRHHDEREYSFVDATSFAFMRRHGIAEALAFDGDFAAAGFVELRP